MFVVILIDDVEGSGVGKKLVENEKSEYGVFGRWVWKWGGKRWNKMDKMKVKVVEMRMLRCLCGGTRLDKIRGTKI